MFVLGSVPCILVIYCFILNSSNNNDKDRKRLYISKAKEFNDFINKDADMYLQSMTVPDHGARKNPSKDVADLKSRAIQNFTQFTDSYVQLLREYIPVVNDFLDSVGISSNTAWVISSTNSEHEQGLPHTRKNVLFIREGTGISTLVHERIHIIQRTTPGVFERYYTKNNWNKTGLHKEPLQRANPDITGVIYTDKMGRKMQELYTSATPNGISDVSGVLHPNEMLAYHFEKLFKSTGLEF
jgi:hypothetical protein